VAPACDATVNLGDVVGYGASPNEVTTRVRAMGGTCVRGNHDKVVSGVETIESFNPMAGLAALWNREHLASDHLDWLRALPKGPVTLDELPGIQFVHGAPEDEDRYVVTAQDAALTLATAKAGVTFFGHTHIQGLFSLQGDFVEAIHPEYASIGNQETWDFQLDPAARHMVNPGSIGQPRDGDWRAAFAVFDSEARRVTFYRVPYDVRAAQEKIFTASLPARLATRLAAGR
jgi:diadenosine tetraphosphatase ApaH/serine/threonine PP2A family protein phosphatase